MKNKSLLSMILILIGLAAATGGSYAFARFFLDPILPAEPGLPLLSRLHQAAQTQNGYTAKIESYYADATRLVFRVHVTGGNGIPILDRVSLKDEHGVNINSSMGIGPATQNDPSVYLIEFNPIVPQPEDFKGKLDFVVVKSPSKGEPIAQFSFNLSLRVHPALRFEPKQSYVSVSGMKILLDRLVITPAYTQAYLCYIKPSEADWGVSNETTLKIGNQQTRLNSYSLLFDADYGQGNKGGEPGWTPPVQDGRCVKLGFPIGDANPRSLTLTIPALEQSMPEVIPAENLAMAYPYLLGQGIDMEWHIVDHGAYPEYKKLPPGMSEQQAYRKFIEALGYVYNGQWEFNVQLKPQDEIAPVFSTSTYGMATPIPLPSTEPRVVAELPGRIRSFDISPDFKTIALATLQGAVFYDLKSFRQIRALEGNSYLAAWSPDGKELASADLIMTGTEFGKSHLIVWDTSSWQVIFEETGEDETLDSIYGDTAWSPDSHFLADSINGNGVIVHDVQTGKVISHQGMLSAYGISWTPDGSRLVATGDLAYGIRRWKVSTDESVRLFDQRASSSLKIAWSPDGERIASGHFEGKVCFWTAATNKCDGFIHAHQNAVYSLAWSPDGNQLATGGGIIRIWDSHTGQLLRSFGQNDGSIYTQLEWPAFNQPLVSLEAGYGSEGLTIVRFWDVDTGQILYEFHGASGSFGE